MKLQLIEHAKKRMKERVAYPISKKEIEKYLVKRNICFVKKLTASRSLAYCVIESIPIKVVISKTTDKVITILPMENEFKTDWVEVEYNNKIFRIRLYPDCFIETENPQFFTEFERLNNDEWIKVKKNKKNNFIEIFTKAWEKYFGE